MRYLITILLLICPQLLFAQVTKTGDKTVSIPQPPAEVNVDDIKKQMITMQAAIPGYQKVSDDALAQIIKMNIAIADLQSQLDDAADVGVTPSADVKSSKPLAP